MALALAALLVIADRGFAGNDRRWLDLVEDIGQAACGKHLFIQVRAKDVSPEAFEHLAREARARVPDGVPLLLNGTATQAEALGYDGVHWPESAIPGVPDTASTLGYRFAAVHSADAVRRAEQAGADAVVFAPVYEPRSKPGTGRGLAALYGIVQSTSLPVFALGGITAARTRACLDAGAGGVATISGVLGSPDPAAAVDAYLDAMQEVVT